MACPMQRMSELTQPRLLVITGRGIWRGAMQIPPWSDAMVSSKPEGRMPARLATLAVCGQYSLNQWQQQANSGCCGLVLDLQPYKTL